MHVLLGIDGEKEGVVRTLRCSGEDAWSFGSERLDVSVKTPRRFGKNA